MELPVVQLIFSNTFQRFMVQWIHKSLQASAFAALEQQMVVEPPPPRDAEQTEPKQITYIKKIKKKD